MLEVRLLGQFDVRLHGELIEIPARPSQFLLAYLILSAGTTHPRDKLAGLLSPDVSEASARSHLRTSLSRLRKALGSDPEFILADKLTISFDASAEYWLDAAAIEKESDGKWTPGDLISIVSAYEGELLPGFYDDWALLRRDRLQAAFDQKMQMLMDLLVEAQRWQDVLEWGERWIALGQVPEPAYRALMVTHAALGDMAKLALVYSRCVDALEKELGVEPSEQTRTTYERLARGEAPTPPSSTPFEQRYRLEDEIGRGGMGVVYRAHDTVLEREVAVKILKNADLGTEGQARLLHEARAAASLNHPNIVSVYDAGDVDGSGKPFIVMELVEGKSLHERPPETFDEIVKVAQQLCLALEHAHAQGIIHRDLKPENVVIAPDGGVKLMDFGLARSVASRMTSEGQIVGTVFYMAPEQAMGQDLDARADLYALGVMLYEMTTGQLPFEDDNPIAVISQHVHAPIVPPRAHNEQIPVALDALIVRLLSKQREDRPASAREVLAALERFESNEAPASGGTVTFLFTDIQGSTQLLHQLRDQYATLLADQRSILRAIFADWGGHEIDTEGDAIYVSFPRATDAVKAVVEMQRVLAEHVWPEGIEVKVRMGLHTGEPLLAEEGYVGIDVHRAARIGHIGHGGQVLLSETTAALVHDDLPKEVGLRDLGQHRLKDIPFPERIFQLVIPQLPSDFPTLKSLDDGSNNLPPQTTPFVGREAELSEIGRLLKSSDCRLLTLLGPGGMGKTRLALEAAANQIGAFLNGVYFVPLAAVNSGDNLASTVANVLNLKFYSSEDLEAQLINYLREKQLLLLMDNFEHLLEGATLVTDILAGAAHVKVLATSRERLGLQAEWTFDVQGLPFPDTEISADLEKYAAVELFLQGARHVNTSFEPDEEDKHYISRICQLVQGMPLGIELAAAWINTITCREIAAEIEQGLDFLETELRDVPERHRSIRAVLKGSWNLMPDAERGVFKRLSVFRGGFTKDAAEHVAGASLKSLSALVSKSLIRHNASGRFEMHELLRQYAEEKLDQNSAETVETQRLHAAYFTDYVHAREAPLMSGERKGPIDELEEEIGNLRAGWQWLVKQADISRLGKWSLSLFFFYETLGWYREGETAHRPAVEAVEESRAKSRQWSDRKLRHSAMIMTGHGWFIWRLGRPEQAEIILREAVAMIRKAGAVWESWMPVAALANVLYDLGKYEEARQLFEANRKEQQEIDYDWPWIKAQSLVNLGRVAYTLGHYEDARRLLQEGLKILRPTGDQLSVMLYLHNLGSVSQALGDYDEAREIYQEGLEIGRTYGYPLGQALALNDLGNLADQQGAYDRAKERYHECLTIYREIGDRRGIALALNRQGLVTTAIGNYDEARRHFNEGMALYKKSGNRRGMALTLNNLSVVHRVEGDYQRARELCEESLTICRELTYSKGIALSLVSCGDVALGLEDYAEARSLYDESLEINTAISFQAGIVRSRIGLGNVSRVRGDSQESEDHFHAGLKIAMEIRATPMALEALIGLAALLIADDEGEGAVQLFAVVRDHEASTAESRMKVQRMMDALAEQLPHELILTAIQKGEQSDLEELVNTLLSEENTSST